MPLFPDLPSRDFRRSRPLTLACLAGTVLAFSAPALAQEDTTPIQPRQTPPSPSEIEDEEVRRTLEDLQREPTVITSIRPNTGPSLAPVRPGVPGIDPISTRAPLVAEGTFLPSRRGRMHQASTGEWVFEFDPDEAGRAERPMVLLPNSALATMIRYAERGDDAMRIVVSGQTLVYHNRNYLLVTAPPRLVRLSPIIDPRPEEAAPAVSPAPEGDAAAQQPDVQPAESQAERRTDTDVSDLIAELEAAAGTQPATLPRLDGDTGGEREGLYPHEEPDALEGPTPGLAADGAFILARTGRMVRSPRGVWEFVFDNAPGTGRREAAMVLMPGGNLQAMERDAERLGDSARFTVSGRVFVFRNRNYLLPTMFRLTRLDEQITPG